MKLGTNADPRGVNDNEEDKQPLIKNKDTSKIKTNPKYKCVDDGSDDGDADEKQHEDY